MVDSGQRYGFPDYLVAAAESISPQAIADDYHWCAVRTIFVRRELASEDQLYAQDAEESSGDSFAINARWRSRTRQVKAPKTDSYHLLERASIAQPIEKVRIRHRHLALQCQIVLSYPNQSIRLRVRQRGQDNRLNHAENGCVRADS